MPKKYSRVRQRKKRSNSSWKLLKKRFRIRKRLHRAGLALLVFFSVLLTLGLVYAWHFFTRPFARASGEFDASVSWDGRFPLNLLWIEVLPGEAAPLADLAVASLNPTSGRFTIFRLPLEYKVPVEMPLQGDQLLRLIYGAGDRMEPNQGLDLTVKSVSYLLGIPLEGYLLANSEGVGQLRQLYSDATNLKDYFLIKNVTRFPQIIGLAYSHLKTNLTLGEMARVVYYIWKVRSDRVKEINLNPEHLANQGALDNLITPFLQDELIVGERLKVQILNGTTKPGLASFAARVIENAGGDVIRVGNYERQDLTKGFLVLEESGSYTARWLARVFGVVDSRPPSSSIEKRADITIVLGSENYERVF